LADQLAGRKAGAGKALAALRFAGVSLGGGKADRTAVAVLDYFPSQRRVFLRNLHERVRADGEISGDQALHAILAAPGENFARIALDAPLKLPVCARCELPCPGVEACAQPEIEWMRKAHRQRAASKRPLRMFTPYTERPAEMWLASALEEPFFPPHALGANAAPLSARARFVLRRMSAPAIEVYPKAAIWRIGRALRVQKSYLRYHKHSVEGDEARMAILQAIVERGIAFIYQQDLKAMVEHNQAFEAFICGLVAFLKERGQTEAPPAGFPPGEAWIEVPKAEIEWF
jgi:predicted nuclease with RNAse H fold